MVEAIIADWWVGDWLLGIYGAWLPGDVCRNGNTVAGDDDDDVLLMTMTLLVKLLLKICWRLGV